MLFGVAALMLPWRFDPIFSTLCLIFSLSAVITGAVLFSGARTALRLWRIHAFIGLAMLTWLTVLFTSAAAYLSGLYGPLGTGLGSALFVVLCPGYLFILPSSLWAIGASGGFRGRSTALVVLLALVPIVDGIRWASAPARPRPPPDRDAWAEALRTSTSTRSASRPLHVGSGFDCRNARGASRALIVFRGRSGERHRCVHGVDDAELRAEIRTLLTAEGALRPIKLDVARAEDPVESAPPIVAAFRLRAGRDGACIAGRCFAPWQLAAKDAYTAYEPLPFIPDLRIGIDPQELRKALGLPESDASPWTDVVRVRIDSFVFTEDGRLVAMDRLRPVDGPAVEVDEAIARAERFLRANQQPSGRFNYLVDPFSGPRRSASFSIARQAGTTLALCEYGSDASREVVRASLDHLTRFERGTQEWSAMAMRYWSRTGLGPASLSLAAFAQCESRFDFRVYDALMVRLARFIIGQEVEDTGRFHPNFDLKTNAPIPGPHRLYADGQAVLALVLLANLAERPGPVADAFEPEELRAVARRAMGYITGPYWPWPYRSFFFLEENWHCLAAKAALGAVRDDAYERFCLGLARWRSRLVVDAGVPDEGAYHFGHVSAPYITPTGGFLEAGSAALEVAKARGEPAPILQDALRRASGFIRRTQWDEVSCFACNRQVPMVGAFSETLASTIVRVDFVQHAMAGLAGAERALSR